MKNVVAVIVALVLCSMSLAQTSNAKKEAAALAVQKNYAQVGRNSTSTCSFTFTSGANNTYLKYCVTVNGNISQLQTPLGHEHIAVGLFGEGYGICDTTTPIAYFDYADFGDSGNWNAPLTTQPNATTVKVVRTTSDGLWTLTQVITQAAGNSSIKVAMTLKNNDTAGRVASLLRYADVDADSVLNNNFDATVNSAWGNNSIGYGLMLQNVGTPPIPSWTGLAQTVPNGPAPCNPLTNVHVPLTATDGSIFMFYDNALYPAHGMKTFTMIYKGL